MISIRKNEYPSKETVNLVIRERNLGSPAKAIPLFCLFLLLLAGFVRFFVIWPLNHMNAAQVALNQVQVELKGYEEYNRDYYEVKEEYSRYFDDYLYEDEIVLQDRLLVLELLESRVMNRSNIESISIQDNVCHMVITEVPLYRVSDIVADLEQSPLVQYIAVSTAKTENEAQNTDQPQGEQQVTADMTITLTGGDF